MSESNLVYLRKQKRYSLMEARTILPLIKQLTELAEQEAAPLMKALQDHVPQPQQVEMVQRLQQIVDAWSEEIVRLGAIPKGIWLVDFDHGDGFFCWKYNEDEIAFCHGYHESFAERTPIA